MEQDNNNESHTLSQEITNLVEYIFDKRQLRFKMSEVSINYPTLYKLKLIDNDGIIASGLDGALTSDKLLVKSIIKAFAEKLNYSVSYEMVELLDFCKKIRDYFGRTHGATKLIKDIVEYLIVSVGKKNEASLYDFARKIKLTEDSDKFYWFYSGFFNWLKTSNVSFSILWSCVTYYTGQIGDPQPNTIDGRWNELGKFLNVFIANNKDSSQEIKTIVFNDLLSEQHTSCTLVVLRILKIQQLLTTDEVIEWFDNPNLINVALDVLCVTEISTQEQKQKIIDIIFGLNEMQKKSIQCINLIVNVLNSSDAGDAIAGQCRLMLDGNLTSNNDELISQTLQIITGGARDISFVCSIFERLISLNIFKSEYLNIVSAYFVRTPDLSRFIIFLKGFAVLPWASKHLSLLDSAIYVLRQKDAIAFEEEELKLTIDNNGSIRKLGHEILFSALTLNQQSQVSFDVLKLDALQQYKLAISLLIPRYPVEHSIPIAIKLLKSRSGIVQEVVLSKLIELVESYKYYVVEQVEFLLDDTYLNKEYILTELQASLKLLAASLEEKSKIKEFDPTQTQAIHLRNFMSGLGKSHQENANSAVNNYGGILQYAKKITVARGGGSIMPNGTIRPLGYNSVSFTMPRTMFLAPEHKDYEHLNFFLQDWKTEFEPWERIILSSANI